MLKKLLVLLAISIFIISCKVAPNSRQVAESKQEETAKQAISSVEIPTIKYFQERRTIKKWAERWDKPSVPSYVYLISFGKILGYYVVNGKPASTRSYLTPEETADSYNGNPYVLSTPDIDGTYGDNNAGIRFFTAEGAAVEWAGDGASYIYSDVPIKFGYDVPKLNSKK